jgi:hypothetical protein
MVAEAKRGLEWRREYGRGGTAVGVARARDISNEADLSISTIKRMHSFLKRSADNEQAEGYEPGEKGFPSAGRIAYALWGGKPALSWAQKKVKEIENVEKLNKFEDMNDDDEASWLEYLKDKGEEIDTTEWELLEETDVTDAESEAEFHNQPTKLFKRFADPDERSKLDKGLYKIRYRYSENVSDNSRLFCKNMVANAKLGVIYRFEDIKEMGDAGINSEFAERGKSKYSIWLYKGGCYCHHNWIRQVWFRKRVGGKFLPNEGLDNDKDITGNEPKGQGLRNGKGWKKANTKPKDMPNRAKIN